MRFFREHWFGSLVSLLVAVYVLMFVLVLAAPRQDEKQRGFVKCTAVMQDDLLKCQKSLFFVNIFSTLENKLYFCECYVSMATLKEEFY